MDVNEDVLQPGTAPNSYFNRAHVMRICCTCMFFFPKTSDQNRLTLSCRLVLHRPLASDQAVHLPCLSQGGAKDAGGCHETDVEDASLVCFLTVLRGI